MYKRYSFGSPCTMPTQGRMDKGNRCVRIHILTEDHVIINLLTSTTCDE